ncbi:MAG: hypothetical protein CMF50_09030 [Legionellales bacterium]|mgnify:CR=1 FL=1|nr:hypothetical protein [Legionellales bacterium]|tara:strand:- start:3496 stop:4524 length:1029 start_codon:yes stop_codon:yes gene_type:complete
MTVPEGLSIASCRGEYKRVFSVLQTAAKNFDQASVADRRQFDSLYKEISDSNPDFLYGLGQDRIDGSNNLFYFLTRDVAIQAFNEYFAEGDYVLAQHVLRDRDDLPSQSAQLQNYADTLKRTEAATEETGNMSGEYVGESESVSEGVTLDQVKNEQDMSKKCDLSMHWFVDRFNQDQPSENIKSVTALINNRSVVEATAMVKALSDAVTQNKGRVDLAKLEPYVRQILKKIVDLPAFNTAGLGARAKIAKRLAFLGMADVPDSRRVPAGIEDLRNNLAGDGFLLSSKSDLAKVNPQGNCEGDRDENVHQFYKAVDELFGETCMNVEALAKARKQNNLEHGCL